VERNSTYGSSMASPKAAGKRRRGEIETLPSGSLRVRVYGGIDPVTGRRHYLTEIIPPGPRAAKDAEKTRTRLMSQVDEQRNPRTRATVNQLLDRHLEMLGVEETTLDSYESFARNHIRPLIGDVAVGRINGEILDSFYRQLARCRTHCNRKRHTEHRATEPHDCDERCKPHVCRPLSTASLRKIQAILNAAGRRAVRWEWIGRNPFELAEPIAAPRSEPKPPTAEQAAAISAEAWRDLDWGMMVWLYMTTGARRGEVCALRWERFDTAAAVLVETLVAAVDLRGWSGQPRGQRRLGRRWRQFVQRSLPFHARCGSCSTACMR
jgi:integrase